MNCPKDLVLLLKHKVHHHHFVSQCHIHGDLYHCRNNRKRNLLIDTKEMLCIIYSVLLYSTEGNIC